MTTIYMLYYIRSKNTDNEDIKLIGVYSTESKAQETIERLHEKPGFRDWPQGFEIAGTVLDRDGWIDGFLDLPPSEM